MVLDLSDFGHFDSYIIVVTFIYMYSLYFPGLEDIESDCPKMARIYPGGERNPKRSRETIGE